MREIKLTDLSNEQKEQFNQDYAKHCRKCVEYGIACETIEKFLTEWVDCKKRDNTEENELIEKSDESLEKRDYSRMYFGKAGYDI